MAAALFAARIEGVSPTVEVSSAGVLTFTEAQARPVPGEVLELMAPLGIDLGAHRSRALTLPLLEEADLVIGMSRRHVQEAILLDPPSWPRSFLLKDLVRRGSAHGPRRPDQGFRSWIDEVHGDRTRESLAHRSKVDEVADPYGGTLDDYRSTVEELGHLTDQLARLLWPELPQRPG